VDRIRRARTLARLPRRPFPSRPALEAAIASFISSTTGTKSTGNRSTGRPVAVLYRQRRHRVRELANGCPARFG
jgi:hypothetical protein